MAVVNTATLRRWRGAVAAVAQGLGQCRELDVEATQELLLAELLTLYEKHRNRLSGRGHAAQLAAILFQQGLVADLDEARERVALSTGLKIPSSKTVESMLEFLPKRCEPFDARRSFSGSGGALELGQLRPASFSTARPLLSHAVGGVIIKAEPESDFTSTELDALLQPSTPCCGRGPPAPFCPPTLVGKLPQADALKEEFIEALPGLPYNVAPAPVTRRSDSATTENWNGADDDDGVVDSKLVVTRNTSLERSGGLGDLLDWEHTQVPPFCSCLLDLEPTVLLSVAPKRPSSAEEERRDVKRTKAGPALADARSAREWIPMLDASTADDVSADMEAFLKSMYSEQFYAEDAGIINS